MKRAWPYALSLAVVVAGCYLALAPLLRSLSPAPATNATSALSQDNNTTTIQKSSFFNGPSHGATSFVSAVGAKGKKSKKTAKKASTQTITAPDTGFARNTPQTSTSSTTPIAPAKTPAKTSSTTKTQKKGAATVGGVVQTPNGDSGLAGPTGSGASQYAQAPSVGN